MSWFGILLGSSKMTGTDCIVFHAHGADSTARDYYSTGYNQPEHDD